MLEFTKCFYTNPLVSSLKHLYKISITIPRKQVRRGETTCPRSWQMRVMLKQFLVFPFNANCDDQDGYPGDFFFLITA